MMSSPRCHHLVLHVVLLFLRATRALVNPAWAMRSRRRGTSVEKQSYKRVAVGGVVSEARRHPPLQELFVVHVQDVVRDRLA